MDPSVLFEGVGGSAAAVGVARKLRRTPRVRRDPIDVQLVAAEAAEAAEAFESDAGRDADEILAALEAEVGRTDPVQSQADPVQSRAATEPVVITAPAWAEPAPRPAAASPGISGDQVNAWMAQIQDDLAKVRSRIQYLQLEQARLEDQQRLMAQLMASSNPI